MPCAALLAAVLAAGPTTSAPASAPAMLPDRYMALSEVRPGMKGLGKSVFKGTEIAEFEVEVIGVLRRVGPQQDVILVRCAGQGLEESGVIMGMSGSPIYIDGKLVGALAYAWRFSKAPLAGITPIEAMLRIGAAPPASVPSRKMGSDPIFHLPPITVDGRTYGRIRLLDRPPEKPLDDEADLPTLSPIVTPVTVKGVGPQTLAQLRPILAQAGCLAVPTGGAAPGSLPGLEPALEPGAVCAVSLATGDIDLTAIGTVTDRVGDTVWAFGHPFNGDGAVELPLSTGAILAVLPSVQNSVKFGVPLKAVGRISHDEVSGLRGTLGASAATIPLHVRTHRPPRPPADYRIALLRHPALTPSVLRLLLAETLTAPAALPQECTVAYEATLDFAGQPPLRLANVFAGPLGAGQTVTRVALVAQELLTNDIQKLDLRSVDVAATVEEGMKSAAIESVRLDTPRLKPGQDAVVQVVLRPYRGEREVVTLRLPIPRETPEGPYTIAIADARSALRTDLTARPHRLEPRTVEDLIAVLSEERDNRKVYARLTLPEGGVAVDGRELPRLPDSAVRLLGAAQWTGSVTPLRRLIAADIQTPYVIEDGASVQVEVTHRP
jgi:hypothetical protein